MKLSLEREKLINAIIFFSKNTKSCNKLKLMKLLYYLDFWHFKETGRPVTNQTYRAWKMGPVPLPIYKEISPENLPEDLGKFLFVEEEIVDEIKEIKKLKITAKKDFNQKIFTKREIEIMNRVAEIFYDAPGNIMKDATHLKNAPWDKTVKEKGENAVIDYMLALDNEDGSLTADIVNDKLSMDKENRELLKSL